MQGPDERQAKSVGGGRIVADLNGVGRLIGIWLTPSPGGLDQGYLTIVLESA